MDRVTREVADRLGLDYDIKDEALLTQPEVKCRFVPRWDDWLATSRLLPKTRKVSFILNNPEWLLPLKFRPILPGTVGWNLSNIRKRLLSYAKTSVVSASITSNDADNWNSDPDERSTSTESSQTAGQYLLIRRSNEPAYYKAGGGADNPSYGIARRGIANIDGLYMQLKDAGLPVVIYEPGAESLFDQINTFHQAKGLISMRGAEFTNLIWMQPQTPALMFNPSSMPENNLLQNLAYVQKVRLTALPVETTHPVIKADEIIPILQGWNS
ncbi:MAG: glycosyltransferase family 61 protein [Cyanobacteria bacterium P01_H01_bin.15]